MNSAGITRAGINRAGISRAGFLAGAAGVGAALLTGTAGTARAAGGGKPGLTHRGVVYTVGAGETPATAWSATRMRHDLRAVQRELHADSIDITGDGVERLTATTAEAAERGLHIWLQPTLGDVPERDILDHLAETGRFAERLRRQGARVDLSVGCEAWLFVPGIVPGADALERVKNLLEGNVDHERMQRKLDAFIARAARVGRSVFHGKLSYAAAQEDEVDWSLFDVVGLNYYAHFPQPADHVRELKKYLRFGKPLAITEFGSCAFKGAPEQGGMGWYNVDYSKEPPEVKEGLIRSERTQAAYLTQLVDVFESLGLYAAQAFEFVSPDSPYSSDPKYDYDMVGYSIVKTVKDRPGDPASGRHWERKEAFHALARRYARAGARN